MRIGHCSWRKLWRSRSGAAAVEFAVAAPVMITMITGAIELSYFALARTMLEDSVRQAARFGITGASGTSGVSRADALSAVISEQMDPLIDESTTTVTYVSYPTMAGVGQPETWTDANANGRCDNGEQYREINGVPGWQRDMGRANSLGGPGDVIVYTVVFRYEPLLPYFSFLGNDEGELSLTARAVARNQIWQRVTPTTPTLSTCP
jgi:hypothetical protein